MKSILFLTMIILLSLLFDFTHKKQLNKPDLESKENEHFLYFLNQVYFIVFYSKIWLINTAK